MDVTNFWWQSAAATPAGIGNSLRFRGAQHLYWKPAASLNRTTATYSFWVKRSSKSGIQGLISSRGADKSYFDIGVNQRNDGDMGVFADNGSFSFDLLPSVERYRDPAAWYHVVYQCNTTGTTSASTAFRRYINGVEYPAHGSQTIPSGWKFGDFTFTYGIVIGARGPSGGTNAFFEGYMAEVHFVDGQALDPTSFGEFNADGVWVPKAVSGVTYGTNGFYLDFSDAADIGADRSGNGNDFTATGFDFTAANGYSGSDLTPDSPTNNQSTNYNLLTAGTVATTLGPWFWSRDTSTWNAQVPQALLPKSGKWWVEFGAVWGGASSESVVIGFVKTEEAATKSVSTLPGYVTGYGWANPSSPSSLWFDHSVQTTIAPSISVAAGNRYKLGLAIDCDQATPTVQLWQNAVNDWADTAGWTKKGDVTLDRTRVDAGLVLTTSIYYGNAGPRFFSTNPTTDAAGYKVFHSQDLPAVAITNPSDHFTTILDTGANILTAAQAKFPNGLWWIKSRTSSNEHQFVDSVRGGNLALQCPSLALETAYVAPANNSVGWCWNAPDTFTGSGGSIASSGQRNTTAGFSIVSYKGTGVAGTIAHGLSQAPEFVIVKNRLASGGFVVAHKDIDILNGNLALNTANPPQGFGSGWVDALSAATFSIKAGGSNIGNVGSSGADYIAYCWHSVPGYSSIGAWDGNGSDDGPFVYTGFRPAVVLFRNVTSGPNAWHIYDSPRTPYNPMNKMLMPNKTDPEESLASTPVIDFVSNGIKLRKSGGGSNNSGNAYVYIAFAEHCFGGSNVSPSPAR